MYKLYSDSVSILNVDFKFDKTWNEFFAHVQAGKQLYGDQVRLIHKNIPLQWIIKMNIKYRLLF